MNKGSILQALGQVRAEEAQALAQIFIFGVFR